MIIHRQSVDRIVVLGSALGIVSLLLGWLTLRPNRLAAGSPLYPWDAFGPLGAGVIAALWAFSLALSLSPARNSRIARIAPGVIASVVLLFVLLLAGAAAKRLVPPDSVARVSVSSGLWLTLAGVWMVAYASSRWESGWRRHAVAWAVLVIVAGLLASGWLNGLSVIVEYEGYRDRFWAEALQHVKLSAFSVAVATVIGAALGLWASRSRVAKGPIFFISNTLQTVPSLALFGLVIAPLSSLSFTFPVLRQLGIRGIGVAPAIIALIIYSLLPVVQNTFTGIMSVDPAASDAGRGMGMSRWQIFGRIEVPLAAPLLLEGVRIASVQAVGLTTVAAVIGAGGLGWFVFRGIGQAATDLILLGAIPIIALALVVDAGMALLIRLTTPRGVKTAGGDTGQTS